MPRGFWTATFKLVVFVAVVLGIAVGVLRTFFVDVVTVAHNGMAPTLLLGDRVLVWRDATIDRNDIALCPHPSQAGRWVLGRVVALPGHSVHVERGQLVVDRQRALRDVQGSGQFVDRETGRSTRVEWGVEQFGDYQEHRFMSPLDTPFVMPDQADVRGLFLLGDNRSHFGEDSRAFGVVPAERCRGQVFMRLTAAEGMPEGIPHRDFQLVD